MKVIKVTITGRTSVITSSYPYDKLLAYWSYSVPGYQYMRRRFPGWDGKIKLLKYDKVPAGLFWATYKQIEQEQKVKFRIKTDVEWPEFISKPPKKLDVDKYSFQGECVGKMIIASQYGGGLVVNATGSGKTRIASMYFSCLKGHGLFVVDQLDLLEQAQHAIGKFLREEIGYVGNSVFKPRRITVATVQTMHKHRKDPRFQAWTNLLDVIFIDEVHVQMNRSNFDVVANIQPKAVYGLTATLQLQKKPVAVRAYALAGPVVYTYPLKEGMKSGVLAKGIILRLLLNNRIPGVNPYRNSSSAGDPRETPAKGIAALNYRDEYTLGITKNSERNAIIARLVRYAYNHGKYIIILVERLKHMKYLSRRLKDVPHRLVAGTVSGEHMLVSERQKVRRKFESGKVRVIIANKVFKKGVDIKRVDLIIDGAGLKSKDDAVQKFGRGIRTHADKAGLSYIDITDVDPNESYIQHKNRYIRLLNDNRKKLNEKWERQGKRKRLKMIPEMKCHRLHRAAKSRKRAYVKAGIKCHDFKWESDGEVKEIFKKLDKMLRKELK